MRRRAGWTVGSIGAMALAVAGAAAAPPSVRTPAWELHYEAPLECPNEADFRAALTQRIGRSAPEPTAKHRIGVNIRRQGERWAGQVTVTSTDGSNVERRATAAHCDELTPALALMTAIALELDAPSPSTTASASSAQDPAPASASATPLATPSTSGSTASGPQPAAAARPTALRGTGARQPTTTTRTAAPTSSTPARSTSTDDAATTSTAPPSPHRLFVDVSANLQGRSLFDDARLAMAPGLAIGSTARQGWAPWLRLGAERVTADVRDASASASLRWWLAHVDLCSHRWPLVGPLVLSPCVRIEGGLLEANGHDLDQVQRSREPYISTGGLLLLETPIVGPLVFRVHAGFALPLVRYRLYADPGAREVAAMPTVLGIGGIGVGVRLW